MCVIQEATFERLLSRYERAFGAPPPFSVATVDDAIAFMRERLGTRMAGPAGDTRSSPFAGEGGAWPTGPVPVDGSAAAPIIAGA